MKKLIGFLLVMGSLNCYSQKLMVIDSTYKPAPINCLTGAHPLYVVDNRIFPCDSIQFINPRDIEAISIYKDAEAQTLYGAAGSRNGTVAITTKTYAALMKRNREPGK